MTTVVRLLFIHIGELSKEHATKMDGINGGCQRKNKLCKWLRVQFKEMFGHCSCMPVVYTGFTCVTCSLQRLDQHKSSSFEAHQVCANNKYVGNFTKQNSCSPFALESCGGPSGYLLNAWHLNQLTNYIKLPGWPTIYLCMKNLWHFYKWFRWMEKTSWIVRSWGCTPRPLQLFWIFAMKCVAC